MLYMYIYTCRIFIRKDVTTVSPNLCTFPQYSFITEHLEQASFLLVLWRRSEQRDTP